MTDDTIYYQVINQHLLRDLTDLGVWSTDVKQQMIADNGSIQKIQVLLRKVIIPLLNCLIPRVCISAHLLTETTAGHS